MAQIKDLLSGHDCFTLYSVGWDARDDRMRRQDEHMAHMAYLREQAGDCKGRESRHDMFNAGKGYAVRKRPRVNCTPSTGSIVVAVSTGEHSSCVCKHKVW